MRRDYERGSERPRREHERREHIKREFDGPRPPKPPRPFREEEHRGRHHHPRKKMTTKLFTDKQELVNYVNKVGETGAKIDIFKIEDSLYKVEVIEKIKKEIEIEVE